MSQGVDPHELGPDLEDDGAHVWRGLGFGLPLSLLLWGLIAVIYRLLS